MWQTNGDLTVVDGHTRLAAAALAELETVETYVHYFHDEDAALEYAIRNQRDRRNLTAAEILRCVQVLDRRGTAGRPKLASTEANSQRDGWGRLW